MTQTTILKNLNSSYEEINKALVKAKRTALEYEVFMSNLEHQMGKGKEVKNIDSYFSKLVKRDEKNNNN